MAPLRAHLHGMVGRLDEALCSEGRGVSAGEEFAGKGAGVPKPRGPSSDFDPLGIQRVRHDPPLLVFEVEVADRRQRPLQIAARRFDGH